MTPDPFPDDANPLAPAATEALGTFAFVFLGGAALLQARNPDVGIGLLEVAFAHGAAYALATGALPRAGGGCNPAVTLGLLALGRLAPLRAAVLAAAQCAGAVLAVVALRALFPVALWEAARGTRPVVALDVSTGQAFALEAIATGALMLAILGARDGDRRIGMGAALAAGLAVAAAMLAIAPLTGASLNPARALAPMVVTGVGDGLALHLTAPLTGALLVAMAWRFLAPGATVMQAASGPVAPPAEPIAPPNDDAPPAP